MTPIKVSYKVPSTLHQCISWIFFQYFQNIENIQIKCLTVHEHIKHVSTDLNNSYYSLEHPLSNLFLCIQNRAIAINTKSFNTKGSSIYGTSKFLLLLSFCLLNPINLYKSPSPNVYKKPSTQIYPFSFDITQYSFCSVT